jgi:hypothetical protein
VSDTRTEGLIEGLKAVELAFARYGEIIVLQRLLRDVGAVDGSLRDLDAEAEQLRREYDASRDRFAAVAFEGLTTLARLELTRELDALLLARRREDLRARANEFLPDGKLLWLPAADPYTRRSRFICNLAAKRREVKTK